MSDFGRVLEEDLKWRESELASLKLLASDAEAGTVRHHALLRALCALLYAHYEGFCKFAWDYYFESLEKTGVLRRDCASHIARASMQKDFKEMRGNLSPDAMWDFCTARFGSLMQERLEFVLKLETNSNLWPNLLIENSSAVGLACSAARENAVKLRSLVARRNDIAHGQKMTIANLGEYHDYENAAIVVMHELAISVLEALESESYLARFSISPNT
jgi:hypothetical protein